MTICDAVEDREKLPEWRPALSRCLFLLSLIGLIVVLLLHMKSTGGMQGHACGASDGGCAHGNTSGYSFAAGISLTMWGLGYYLSLIWLSFWVLVRRDRLALFLLWLVSGAAIVVHFYLVYVQFFVTKSWCPYCLISAIIASLIVVVSTRMRGYDSSLLIDSAPPDRLIPFRRLLMAFTLSTLILAGGFFAALISHHPNVVRAAAAGTMLPAFEKTMKLIPRLTLTPGGESLGRPEAPIVIQAFFDYTCPHCMWFERNVFPKISDEYINTGRVRWIRRYLLRMSDDRARALAMVGMCARSGHDSSKIYDILYETGASKKHLRTNEIVDEIKSRGIDVGRISKCLSARQLNVEERLKEETQQGFSIGFRGSPGFVIDGVPYQGNLDYTTFSELLNMFLRQKIKHSAHQ